MFCKAADNKPLKIQKVCQLSTDGANPFIFRYKYDYSSDWLSMSLDEMKDSNQDIPLPLRTCPKGVSKAKKQDLLSLCRSGLIKTEFAEFYENLFEENNEVSEDKENGPQKKKIKLTANNSTRNVMKKQKK